MALLSRFEVSELGKVTVIKFLDPEIRDEMVVRELDGQILRLLEDQDPKNLLLNFAKVSFISSAWLVKLVALNKKMKKRGGKLKLCEIRSDVMEVFKITKLDSLFKIVPDATVAITSF